MKGGTDNVQVGAVEQNELPTKLRNSNIQSSIEVTPVTPSYSGTSTGSYADDTRLNVSQSFPPLHSGQTGSSYLTQRPSLPTLHTRSNHVVDYASHYDSSPIDSLAYAPCTLPRNDSFSNAYSLGDYRSYSGAASFSGLPAATAGYYDQGSGYTFGALQASSFPCTQSQSTRLPSVTTDSMLNMNHLNASLPAHAITVPERRLPSLPVRTTYNMPTLAYQAPKPQVRPLGSVSDPKVYMNGFQARSYVPWPTEHGSLSRSGSMSTYTPAFPMPSAQSMPPISESAVAYQSALAPVASSSPDLSPATLPPLMDHYFTGSAASSMPSASGFRSYPTSTSYGLPSMIADDRRESFPHYQYAAYGLTNQTSDESFHSQHSSISDLHERSEAVYPRNNHEYTTHIHQPQPSRPTVGNQRSAAHRISVASLNGEY